MRNLHRHRDLVCLIAHRALRFGRSLSSVVSKAIVKHLDVLEALPSYSAHHDQNKQDNRNQTQYAAGGVSPRAAVRPGGNDADQQEDQNNKKNETNTHGGLQ